MGELEFGPSWFADNYGVEMAEIQWTRLQQSNTLKAVGIVRAAVGSDDPQQNVFAATRAVAQLVPGGVDATNAAFAEAAPDLITGLANVAATLAEHFAEKSGMPVEQILDNVEVAVRTVRVVD
ncbi:hypothetical protein [Mycobacterium sp. IS-1556]|uniref:hypothetical protein n=1 Tax=Mycobacterium sp. IS-1556 TaxID=1772276 RepID=UPI0007417937|nr:hypothetical protein [Mycobacterium sp. IS-1556]KUH91842.1 hypothetical protein AU187_04255 [Mycobacterium sp. IS-1556]